MTQEVSDGRRSMPVGKPYRCILLTVGEDGGIAGGLGRARDVVLAQVSHGEVLEWALCPVGWDVLHDSSPHGAHHARVMAFIQARGVDAVVAGHVGPGMRRVLADAGVEVFTITGVLARTAALDAATRLAQANASLQEPR